MPQKQELLRLDKILAAQGEGSRSQVKEEIARGRVTVNGAVVRDPGHKVNPAGDVVAVGGVSTRLQKHCYLLLNKPAGVVSASSDSREPTVVDLVPPELRRKGLFPAGRLDKDTTGLLLITDDGDFAHRILAPRRHIPKTYLATLDVPVTQAMADGFNAGIQLKDEKQCLPAQLTIVDSHTARVVLHQGMYHQIKRMFGCYGAKVLRLHRIAMGGLTLDEAALPPAPAGSLRLPSLRYWSRRTRRDKPLTVYSYNINKVVLESLSLSLELAPCYTTVHNELFFYLVLAILYTHLTVTHRFKTKSQFIIKNMLQLHKKTVKMRLLDGVKELSSLHNGFVRQTILR